MSCTIHPEWVKFFLDHGADPNFCADRRSPLQLARSVKTKTQMEKDMKDEIVNLLLQYGANDGDESDGIQVDDDIIVDRIYSYWVLSGRPTFAAIEIPDL
jgi:hypothetical protein